MSGLVWCGVVSFRASLVWFGVVSSCRVVSCRVLLYCVVWRVRERLCRALMQVMVPDRMMFASAGLNVLLL